MNRQLLVKQLFEYFYNKVYRGSSFNLSLDKDSTQKLIVNFFTLLYKQVNPQAVGINLLIDYYCFAFEQYVGKDLQRNISLNWIIGKKMVGRWFERKESWKYYADNFLFEYQINTDELRSILAQQEDKIDYLQIHDSEELIKSNFKDGEGRLYNCLNDTTLFNHRSLICIRCSMKSACKHLLSKTNPKLYQNRGYAKTE